jgi:peptide methionine sulfoxide reductase MsrB
MSKQDKKPQETNETTTTEVTVTQTQTTEAPKATQAVERSLYPVGTFHAVEAGLNKLFIPTGEDAFEPYIIPEGQTVQTDADGRIYLV